MRGQQGEQCRQCWGRGQWTGAGEFAEIFGLPSKKRRKARGKWESTPHVKASAIPAKPSHEGEHLDHLKRWPAPHSQPQPHALLQLPTNTLHPSVTSLIFSGQTSIHFKEPQSALQSWKARGSLYARLIQHREMRLILLPPVPGYFTFASGIHISMLSVPWFCFLPFKFRDIKTWIQ